MIYPGSFELKTGFTQIRSMLHKHCLSDLAHQLADDLTFAGDFSTIDTLLGQTAELKYILQFKGNFPSQDYYDLTSELLRIRLPGTFTDPDSMMELKLSLITITEIIRFLRLLNADEFPHLKAITPEELPEQSVLKEVELIIDDKAEIRDKASAKLFAVRKEIRSRISGVDRRINQIMGVARKDGLIQSDAELTIRNGRLVIPLLAANKRKLKGYIHDTSATGQTVFIEPAEVFEINNEIQNLQIEERQEIINILINFTNNLRPHAGSLSDFYRFLGAIDFIRAKAMLAIDLGAVKPALSDKPLINWQQAVHPLLMLSLKQQGRTIVSQDILLSEEKRIMVISGPNAGGKSVCLKTAGLLQYMLQCGLLIPVGSDSEAGIFHKIFLEIGDEQSLENDLSTYSSHLIHIRHFLENADDKTLFLIDEFGAGTEPQLGGAMAEASLEKLSEKGSYGIVTTHYTNLKLLADRQPGIFNAAMLYDTHAMLPLFKLSAGKPGSSFAFEIARKIGFPEQVLETASSKIGHSQLDFEKQLAQLEVDKKFIDQKTAELRVADETLASLVNRYETLLSTLEGRKQDLIKEAKAKAQQLLDNSNRLIENTIRGIKECNAEKETTQKLREILTKAKEEILSEETIEEPESGNLVAHEFKEEVPLKPTGPLRPGSFVRMEGQESIGTISEIRGKQAVVLFGTMQVRTKTDNLIAATSGEIRQWEANNKFGRPHSNVFHQLSDKMAEFRMSIDIRGQKAEEAQESIARYLDQAILLRVHDVRILHGKGDGVLRHILHQYLRDVPEIERYEDEKPERGGQGVTLVYFK